MSNTQWIWRYAKKSWPNHFSNPVFYLLMLRADRRQSISREW